MEPDTDALMSMWDEGYMSAVEDMATLLAPYGIDLRVEGDEVICEYVGELVH